MTAPRVASVEVATLHRASWTRSVLGGCVALALLLTTGQVGFAACTDPGAVTATRAQADGSCPCASASDHGQYVKCVAAVANAAAAAGTLPTSCKGAVKKCAAKSTCGKPGFKTCCLTTCKLTKDEPTCLAKGGSVGACPSCCDACTPGGCTTTTTIPGATTTTTTTTVSTTTTTALPYCGLLVSDPCGTCGVGGVCRQRCDAAAPGPTSCAYHCFENTLGPNCTSDAGCAPGTYCVTGAGTCPATCDVGFLAVCVRPCP